jgi:hypothetical protein
MPTNYITLTRQELYDMVWSKPMSSLAKEFGITDVGLAKRCRAVDVPIPYRGYWARVAAGQEPTRTPLFKRYPYRIPVKLEHYLCLERSGTGLAPTLELSCETAGGISGNDAHRHNGSLDAR